MRRARLVQVRSWLRNKKGQHIGRIIIAHMIVALALVMFTWNPSGYSYAHWVWAAMEQHAITELGTLKAITGLLIACSWAAVITLVLISDALKPRTLTFVAIAVVVIYSGLQWLVGMSDSIWALAWVALAVLSGYIGWLLSYDERQLALERLKRR